MYRINDGNEFPDLDHLNELQEPRGFFAGLALAFVVSFIMVLVWGFIVLGIYRVIH